MSSFVHLRLHSEYDLQKGVARLHGEDNVVRQAAQLQQPALALTDGGNLFGALKFFELCYKNGVKPIIGCEVKIDGLTDTSILCLCASHEGYLNLSKLISRSYHEGGWVRPDWFTPETTAGLIALSGARQGIVGRAVLSPSRAAKQTHSLADEVRDWAARFPNSFYLEVWRANDDDERVLAESLTLAESLGLPMVATHPVQCATANEQQRLDFRLCIANDQRIHDERRVLPLSANPHLLSEAEMVDKFADCPGILENSLAIAQRCNYQFSFGNTHLPSITKGKADSPKQVISDFARAGLQRKLPQGCDNETRARYDERLDYELGIIDDMGFIDYFLIVMDFIRWAKEHNIPVGPGRGSGAGSLVAYALDITTLDPIAYGLLFERFLNPARISMPDIDIDFCVNGRDHVIRYVEEKYGHDRVSQIVTFGSVGAKGAIRDSGRILGLPYLYYDSLARLVPNIPNYSLQQALKEIPELAKEQSSERGELLLSMALQAEGMPRNIGTHAGGVLIAPEPLETYCPRIYATDTQTTVTQMDMGDVEKIGLVKFDFLGLRVLTALDWTVQSLKAQQLVGSDFRLDDIPLDDKKVFDLYCKGDMVGVFQCESSGMRDLMRRLQPDRFSEITALVALYRPGPIQAGVVDSYIKRKHGKEDIEYLHEKLRAALQETNGVCVYQEQVMQIAQLIAGYSLAEADLLRRAMGKKKEDEMQAQQTRFVEGAQANISKRDAVELFNNINKFAGYGFNKSHAAAYALVSYQTAYLKTYYPAPFLAAVASTECYNTEQVRTLIRYMKTRGIAVLPPNINEGQGKFVATTAADGTAQIQYGLYAIKGVGEGVIDDIIEARGDAPFKDLFDFCARLKESKQLPYAIIEKLIYAGALDVLDADGGGNRAALLATLSLALSEKQRGDSLFQQDTSLLQTNAWSASERLQKEYKVLGDFTLSGSFMDLYKDFVPQLPLTVRHYNELTQARELVRVAGLFIRVRAAKQKQQKRRFMVLVMDDGVQEMDVIVDDQWMDMLNKLSSGQALIIVEGETRQRGTDPISLVAKQVWVLDDFLQQRLRQLIFVCDGNNHPTAKELRSNLLPASDKTQATHRCELIIQYNDEHLEECTCSLGAQWEVGEHTYRRLQELLRGNNKLTMAF